MIGAHVSGRTSYNGVPIINIQLPIEMYEDLHIFAEGQIKRKIQSTIYPKTQKKIELKICFGFISINMLRV